MRQIAVAHDVEALAGIYDEVLTGCEFRVSEIAVEPGRSVELTLACPRERGRVRVMPTPPLSDPSSRRLHLRFEAATDLQIDDPTGIDAYELRAFDYDAAAGRWAIQGSEDLRLVVAAGEISVVLSEEDRSSV